MDNNAPITEELKKTIYDSLLEAILSSLEDGSSKEEDAQKSSGFILDRLDNIKSQAELLKFLEELSSRWPVYKDVLLKTTELQLENQASQKIEEAREQIQDIAK